jgi:hypothetical protein
MHEVKNIFNFVQNIEPSLLISKNEEVRSEGECCLCYVYTPSDNLMYKYYKLCTVRGSVLG